MEKRQNHEKMNSERESERLLREPWREKQGWIHARDRTAESERVPERKRARIEKGAVDVPGEPGHRDHEQVAVRHADASGHKGNISKTGLSSLEKL